MKKMNPFSAGFGVAYLILAIMQLVSEGLFPFKIFYTISIVSFNVSVIELIRTLCNRILLGTDHIKHLNEKMQNNQDYMIDPFYSLTEEQRKLANEDLQQSIERVDEIRKRNEKLEKKVKKINEWISFIGYSFVVVCLIITPSLNILDTLITNKMVNVITLLTFSIMFFSIFLNERFEQIDNEFEYIKRQTERELQFSKKIYELSQREHEKR